MHFFLLFYKFIQSLRTQLCLKTKFFYIKVNLPNLELLYLAKNITMVLPSANQPRGSIVMINKQTNKQTNGQIEIFTLYVSDRVSFCQIPENVALDFNS